VAASAAEAINGNSNTVSGHDLGDSDSATRGKADDVKRPRVAKTKRPRVAKEKRQEPAAQDGPADVLDFAAGRDKRLKTQQPELATRGKKLVSKKTRKGIGEWRVDAVKASAGTWAFRLRRQENGKRSKPIYVSRVANTTYEMIREGDYEGFKKQLVASHMPGAVRASYGT
jgi:hypothetical protein